MPFFQTITFTLAELLAMLGLGQAFLLLIHIIWRMTAFRDALPYILYFGVLSVGFGLYLAYRVVDTPPLVDFISWFVWSLIIPVSILMILSMLLPGRRLRAWRYTVIGVVPVFTVATAILVVLMDSCEDGGFLCESGFDLFLSGGIMAQSLCFLWLVDGKISRAEFTRQENPGERYWLIISFLVVNIALIGLSLWYLQGGAPMDNLSVARILLGLVFVYLVSTLIFRVYPPALQLQKPAPLAPQDLPIAQQSIKAEIEKLMKYDKLYQEPNFSRTDLARELDLPESQVSSIVNAGFGLNLSQYINSYRVREAKYLLTHTRLPIAEIASQTGFNSIASFNRVFKDMSGQTPSAFRKKIKPI